MTDDEDHDDADENQGKVHLVVDAGVGTMGPSMCVSLNGEIMEIYLGFSILLGNSLYFLVDAGVEVN